VKGSEGNARYMRLLREFDGQLPAPILCVDSDGKIRAAALPDGSVPGTSLEGLPLSDLLPATDRARTDVLARLREVGRAIVPLERAMQRALGRPTAYAILVTPSETGDDLAPPPALLPEIVDASPAPMLGLDRELRLVLVNASARELLGSTSRVAEPRALDSVFCDASAARSFAERIAGRVYGPVRARLRGDDGAPRSLELDARPVFGGCDEPRGWVVFLREAGAVPRPRAEELEGCIQSVAHDLRGPLTSALGFAGLLERECGGTLGEIGRSYLGRLRDGIDRAQRLLDELVDLARVHHGVLRPTALSPLEVLRQLAAEQKPRLEERAIELSLPSEAPLVFADPTRFYQVAANLLANAIDHMGDVPERRIDVRVETLERATALVVSDNGRGIGERDQSRIFDLYTSLCPSKAGSGLGLAIVKSIMDAHGGRIEVQSRTGEGASFRAVFPSQS
jgi:signal transduction histidine kinase